MMRSFRPFVALLLSLLAVAGCREPDRPMAPGVGAAIAVDSDPPGALIVVDGQATGKRTPEVLRDLDASEHEITARLDTAGLVYSYRARVNGASGDTLISIHGPLVLGCFTGNCPSVRRQHAFAGMKMVSTANGMLFYVDGRGDGLLFPDSTSNSYITAGTPAFAARVSGGEVALGPYDFEYLVGRPAPVWGTQSGVFSLRQPAWILPPAAVAGLRTARGIQIEEEVTARADLPGVIFLRLVFRNITNDPIYRLMDSWSPAAGLTYEDAYVGFSLDPDIGSTSEDDLVSYVPELDLAFVYDSDFAESSLGAWSQRPALVGIRLLEVPAGSNGVLTAWPRGSDWRAGGVTSRGVTERAGWTWLSGATATGFPNHPDPRPDLRIGFAPIASSEYADYRVAATAGPLRLAPGESAAVTVAIVLAGPAAGTFTSGSRVAPGQPTDDSRTVLTIAAPLVERARQAGTVQ